MQNSVTALEGLAAELAAKYPAMRESCATLLQLLHETFKVMWLSPQMVRLGQRGVRREIEHATAISRSPLRRNIMQFLKRGWLMSCGLGEDAASEFGKQSLRQFDRGLANGVTGVV